MLLTGTFLHPMDEDPNDPIAAFSEYSADEHWVVSHLVQLAGMTLIVAALLVVSLGMEKRGVGAAARLGAVAMFWVIQRVIAFWS